jgi:mRNA interferase MazF
MGVVARRFEIYLVSLDPAVGSEIRKRRPCVVISPDEMNRNLHTVIIAPMTTKGRPYPSRVACTFAGRQGHVILDQLRTVDRVRLVKRAGKVSPSTQHQILIMLAEIFAP